MYVGGTHDGFGGDSVECEAFGAFAQADAFQVADTGVQVVQLAVWRQLKLELLATFELSELLGLLIAGEHFIYSGGRQSNLFEQGR